MTSDGQNLEVTRLVNEHEGHERSATAHKHYPCNRKLEEPDKNYARKMLSLNVNKKKLQNELMQKTGKVITLRDLTNISQLNKNGKTRNDLDITIDILRNDYNATVDVCSDVEGNFIGLLLQDKDMQEVFNAYPEILFVDATYKLLELQLPLYILAVEESNGLTEIVGVCVLAVETRESLVWFLEAFKNHNPAWEKTRVVMADKDINEREVIASCLPNAAILICLFHTLRSFRREITPDKVNISQGTRKVLLELVERMAYATKIEEYERLKNMYLANASREAASYFIENWDVIREQWVMGDKFAVGNFLNSTNNRLECLNSKLKQVINKYSSLEDLFHQFFIILCTLRGETDHKAIMSFQKSKFSYYRLTDAEKRYSDFLTNYASKYVLKQIDIASSVQYNFEMSADNHSYKLMTSNGLVLVTPSTCSCLFATSMRLPCRHIFALRRIKDLPLFQENLCEVRWSAAYYKHTQRSFTSVNNESEESASGLNVCRLSSTRTRSHQQKFRIAHDMAKKLANVAAFASGEELDNRMSQMRQLLELWSGGNSADDSLTINDALLSSEYRTNNNDDDEIVAAGNVITGSIHEDEEIPTTSVDVITVAGSDVNLNVNADLSPAAENVDVNTEETTRTLSHSRLNIKVAPAMKRIGRPKGSETTVVGLPKKKAKKQSAGPLTFLQLDKHSRDKKILTWIVGEEKASTNNNLFQECDLDIKYIDPAIFNCDIMCYQTIRYIFSESAWGKLEEMIAQKRNHHQWICDYCKKYILQTDSYVDCQSCLLRYHAKCTEKRRKKLWVCKFCKLKFKTSASAEAPVPVSKGNEVSTLPKFRSKIRKLKDRYESNSSDSESDGSSGSAQIPKKITLKTLALRELDPNSSESEDEMLPNPKFVEKVKNLHDEGTLTELLEQSVDIERNPLLVISNSCRIIASNIDQMREIHPQFFKDIVKVRKLHGCFVFMNNFLTDYYSQFLRDGFSVRISQIEYIVMVVHKLI